MMQHICPNLLVTGKGSKSFISADDIRHVIQVEFVEQEPSNASDAH